MTPSSPLSSPTNEPVDALAFCSLGGHQGGQIFPLDASKIVLNFEAADAQGGSQPTRCLVIQDKNGVTIRTLQGRLAVNNQVCKDALLKLNDEVVCGTARLRLIRRPAATQEPSAAPTSTNDVMTSPAVECKSPVEPAVNQESNTGTQPPTEKFFGPFPWKNDAPSASEGESTLLLKPEQIQQQLAPVVYEDEQPPAQTASPISETTNPSTEIELPPVVAPFVQARESHEPSLPMPQIPTPPCSAEPIDQASTQLPEKHSDGAREAKPNDTETIFPLPAIDASELSNVESIITSTEIENTPIAAAAACIVIGWHVAVDSRSALDLIPANVHGVFVQ